MRRLLALVAAAALLVPGCARSASAHDRTLTVFAASSLTAAFTQIGKDFEAADPGVMVTFNFGPSDGLAASIQSEGTADVFASASGTWMDAVARSPGVSDRADFARNRLVIITPPNDPAKVTSIEDLANPGVKLVLAAAGVPVGDYAREALKSAGVLTPALANVVSNEEDDASVVAKIASGEADAGIVYASDVTEAVAPTVRAVQIPDAQNVIATYPIAVVSGGPQPDLARAFVAFVTGSEGRATLAKFGFLPPS